MKSPSLPLSPMSMGAEVLRHHAFVYDSDEDYARRSADFLREGLNAGECCMVAHNRAGLAVMREALGRDADRTVFVDVSRTYTRPAHAVAAFYGTFVRLLQQAPSVRAVAEFQFGPSFDDCTNGRATRRSRTSHMTLFPFG